MGAVVPELFFNVPTLVVQRETYRVALVNTTTKTRAYVMYFTMERRSKKKMCDFTEKKNGFSRLRREQCWRERYSSYLLLLFRYYRVSNVCARASRRRYQHGYGVYLVGDEREHRVWCVRDDLTTTSHRPRGECGDNNNNNNNHSDDVLSS